MTDYTKPVAWKHKTHPNFITESRPAQILAHQFVPLYAHPAPVAAPAPCDMGPMCLDCQPRGPNGECPDAAPSQSDTTDSIMALAREWAARDGAANWEPAPDDKEWLAEAEAALRAAVERLVREHQLAVSCFAYQKSKIETLQDRLRGDRERAERAERGRDEALALLKEARVYVAEVDMDELEPFALLARIDALRAKCLS